MDITLNEICSIITGRLKPTPITKITVLSGITLPAIRRHIAAKVEKMNQETDDRHNMLMDI